MQLVCGLLLNHGIIFKFTHLCLCMCRHAFTCNQLESTVIISSTLLCYSHHTYTVSIDEVNNFIISSYLLGWQALRRACSVLLDSTQVIVVLLTDCFLPSKRKCSMFNLDTSNDLVLSWFIFLISESSNLLQLDKFSRVLLFLGNWIASNVLRESEGSHSAE